MLTTVEGVYKQGRVELKETPADAPEGRVLVTFLETAMEAKPAVTANGAGVAGKRVPGLERGKIWVSDDFDEPLPDEFWMGAP